MILYRMTDRFFSRHWRRTKNYTEKQLMLIARHQGCLLEKFKGGIRVKKGDNVVANFEALLQPEVYDEKTEHLYAALRNPFRGRTIIHIARPAISVANESISVVSDRATVGRRRSNG